MAYKYTVKQGDTLNGISQSLGYANYKEAGVSAVPSGNFDLIRPGDSIDFPTYDPSKPSTITETSPVLSSKDSAGEYASNSATLDSKFPPVTTPGSGQNPKIEDTGTGSVGTGQTKVDANAGKTGDQKTTGDPLADKMDKWTADQTAKYETKAADDKAQRETLYQNSYAAINQTYANTVANINATFDKSQAEQKRISELNIARVKAYGLGGKTAMVNPIEYTDAVSQREQEADNKLRELDNQRNNLLAQAKSARDLGQNGLLKEKLDALDTIETHMQTEIQAAAEEATRQYNLMRQHQDAVQKMMTAARAKYGQAFADAKTPEEKDKVIKQILAEQGVTESSDLYYQLYTELGSAATTLNKGKIQASRDSAISGLMKQGITDPKQMLDYLNFDDSGKQIGDFTASEIADTLKSFADLDYKRAQTSTELAQGEKARAEARKAAGVDNTEEDTFRKEIPAQFATQKEAEAAKIAFVTKYGKKGRDYWDAIFTNDAGVTKYPIGKAASGQVYKSMYDYDQSTDNYRAARTTLQKGEILIKRNGQVGAIPESEFNAKTDTKL